MANQWFRMYSDFTHNPKVQQLSEVEQRRYVMLLCLNDRFEGTKSFQDDEIAWILRISTTDWLLTKDNFIKNDLIDKNNNIFLWEDFKKFERPIASIWRKIRDRIFKRDDYTCQYCGERGKKLECDHVMPVSKGGSHDDSNLLTACFKCNRSKRDKTLEEWKGRLDG